MPDFHGTIQDGQLPLSATQRELEIRYLASLKNGTMVRLTYTREGPMKTNKQVRTIFGLIVEKVRLRLTEMGVGICNVPANKEMVYAILKKACGGVGDMGETLGLSEMEIDQASVFFENCRDWAATELQLVISDPDPNWRDNV